MRKIIAEVGQAHDGSLGQAHAYIDAIKSSSIDAIKFQMHIADSESSDQESFRVPFSYEDSSRKAYWKRMEFTKKQWKDLKLHCEDVGLEFIVSPFSVKAFEWMEELEVATYKIASGVIDNSLLLDQIFSTKKDIIISTGMYSLARIEKLLNNHKEYAGEISILHCVTAYPAPINNLNLNRIPMMIDKFKKYKIGYSDHSGLAWPNIVAATLGSEIFEYHITFDKRSFGPDSTASLDIDEAINVADIIKNISKSIGTTDKRKSVSESIMSLFGYSLSAKQDILAGEKITMKNLETAKPAGQGISASDYKDILGKISKLNIKKGNFITLDMLQ
jgi:N,N'-diacetyllegionaminate synthase